MNCDRDLFHPGTRCEGTQDVQPVFVPDPRYSDRGKWCFLCLKCREDLKVEVR